MTARKAASGRSTIYQQDDGSWRGEVSFGVDPATGRRLRRKLDEWIAGRELEVRRTTVHGYRADVPHPRPRPHRAAHPEQ